MEIAPATVDDADAVTDLWVALADEQTAHGSHVLAEQNRGVVRDEVTRGAVTDRLLVARTDSAARERTGGANAADAEAAEGANATGAEAAEGTEGTAGADEGSTVVGFVMFAMDRGTYEMAVTQGVIQNIYVAPAYRNEGVGSELLAAAERRLEDTGAETVVLEAMAANLEARRFYRRHGYDQHRVQLEKHVDGRRDGDRQ